MINKHLAFLVLDEDSPYTNSCLFTLDRLPLLLLLRKNQFFSSPKTSQQSVRKPYRTLLIFNSPWFYPFLNVKSFLRKGFFLMEILHDDDCDQQRKNYSKPCKIRCTVFPPAETEFPQFKNTSLQDIHYSNHDKLHNVILIQKEGKS